METKERALLRAQVAANLRGYPVPDPRNVVATHALAWFEVFMSGRLPHETARGIWYSAYSHARWERRHQPRAGVL